MPLGSNVASVPIVSYRSSAIDPTSLIITCHHVLHSLSPSQAKAALKHANRPRLRYRDPDAKARSDAEAAAEQEAAIQLGHYARRITPTATAHWSQQSIDLAQVLRNEKHDLCQYFF